MRDTEAGDELVTSASPEDYVPEEDPSSTARSGMSLPSKRKGKQRQVSQPSSDAEASDDESREKYLVSRHSRYATCLETQGDSPADSDSVSHQHTGDLSFDAAYYDAKSVGQEETQDVAASPAAPTPSPDSSPLFPRAGITIASPAVRGSSAPRHRRQYSQATSCHTAGLSSLGTPSEFDFFSTSIASTAPTSVHSHSPASPKFWAGAQLESVEQGRQTVTMATTHVEPPQGQSSGHDPEPLSDADAVAERASVAAETDLQHQQAHHRLSGLPWPASTSNTGALADNGHHLRRLRSDSLPAYDSRDRLPEYSGGQSAAADRTASPSRRRRVRSAIAARAASSRLVPNAVARRLQPSLTDRSLRADSLPNSRPELPRRQSAPSRNVTSAGPQRIMYTWSAQQFYMGAVMGPSVSVNRSRPSTAASSPFERTDVRHTMSDYGRSVARSLRGFSSANATQPATQPATPGDVSPTLRVRPRQRPSPGREESAQSEGGTPSGVVGSSRSLLPNDLRALSDALFKVKREVREPKSSPRRDCESSASCHQSQSASAGRGARDLVPVTSNGSLRRPALLRSALTAPTASTAVDTAVYSGSQVVDPFNAKLPKEIRLEILRMLIRIHIEEHEREIDVGLYRGQLSRSRDPRGLWRAMQELIKLARVSKTFLSLTLDGQLWRTMQFAGLPDLRLDGLKRLFESAGPFVTTLDLAHFSQLDDEAFSSLLQLLARHEWQGRKTTAVTSLNLGGLRRLSKGVIVSALQACPMLRTLCIRDAPGVDNKVLLVLGEYCPLIESLDVSRCKNANAYGILAWLGARLAHEKVGAVHTLKAASMRWKHSTDLHVVGSQLPDLCVLDVSGSNSVVDAALRNFLFPSKGRDRLELTARQCRPTYCDDERYRAIMPRLRHLNLSQTAVTELGCYALAYGALPALEILELADCAMSSDSGLVALLESSPKIRRLDLDGVGRGVTERVLQAITPPKDSGAKFPGSQLTHLILSRARAANPTTLMALVESCPKLHHLEVDNTDANDALASRFVQILQERRKRHRENAQPPSPPAYLSLVDCRFVTRSGCHNLFSAGDIRSRNGQRGPAYNVFNFSDPNTSLDTTNYLGPSSFISQQISHMVMDECNPDRTCVKSFWYWQMVDKYERQNQKREARRLKRANRRGALLSVVGGAKATSGAGTTTGNSNTAMTSTANAVSSPSSSSSSSGAQDTSTTSRDGDPPRTTAAHVNPRELDALAFRNVPRAAVIRDRIRYFANGLLLLPVSIDSDEEDDVDDDDATRAAACIVM